MTFNEIAQQHELDMQKRNDINLIANALKYENWEVRGDEITDEVATKRAVSLLLYCYSAGFQLELSNNKLKLLRVNKLVGGEEVL